ncbi:hypothetical protein BATDEDRAFT_21298 [Batrachochytrium dendrobatidis JAM81]|uniref:Rab-GAP TBC domain-containing protein n=1 Tax=Batrachochytrium dendrobatidis (strain JAM81 / FGSC 10211) TaxID=684364 RepID=F4NS88_BATDJ|nr:uncharacterized protein BATDEDRAFT_21298 [Batrachochytrium dendrobatidis JAM81]EGF83808.1 hypothetical protein BATDEDRAFT_21298 [Batrachochytrium dendrobatidis JAM81]|eukprot:XP_006675250.1 hypothetical protein BATDEDRAFT_21298 [Batrachochytrium dendrobatidis JAM81]
MGLVKQSPSELETLSQIYATRIQATSSFWIEKKRLMDSLVKNAVTPQELEILATKSFNEYAGFRASVENYTTIWHQRHTARRVDSSVQLPNSASANNMRTLEDQVQTARIELDRLIKRRLNSMSTELNLPLTRERTPLEKAAYEKQHDGESSMNVSDMFTQTDCFPSKGWNQNTSKTCLYDDEDLLKILKSIKSDGLAFCNSRNNLHFMQSINGQSTTKIWSALNVHMPTCSLEDMQSKFHELHPKFKHVGVDDIAEAASSRKESFLSSHIEIGQIAIASQSCLVAQQYAKHGIPPNLRPQLWNLMIQCNASESYSLHVSRVYKGLRNKLLHYDLLVDKLIQLDSKHSANDNSYFVFEDMVCQILLLWTRDEWLSTAIATNTAASQNRVFKSVDSLQNDYKLEQSAHSMPKIFDCIHESCIAAKRKFQNVDYPQNGIYPISGISLYAMPICFVYADPGHAYLTFRELYARYFSRLHCISSKPETLLHLCLTFEVLMKQADAVVFYHLSSSLQLSPLNLVFKWILYGFVGILDCEQVLLLWDRVIAFDSLELIPLTAVALVYHRRKQIMEAQTADQVYITAEFNSCMLFSAIR